MPVISNPNSTDNIQEQSFVGTSDDETAFVETDSTSIKGLSELEKQDPNKIIVTISNQKVPLVV